MSAHEWKPGDVAMVEENGMPTLGIRTIVGDAAGWMMPQARVGDYRWFNDCTGNVRPLRPLVVIDPEDREQVERLDAAYQAAISPDRPGSLVDVMQAALREIADPKPRKPEEPTGKFAAVVDADGREWVRTRDDLPGYLGVLWMDPERLCHRAYARINAVRVLSEGAKS